MSAFDDALAEAESQPRFRIPVRLLLDASAYNRAATLQADLDDLVPRLSLAKASTNGEDVTETSPLGRARELAEQLVEVHETHPPTSFVFEALPAKAFSDLDAEHKGDRGPTDDFWCHLMAASCVEPEGSTVEGWQRWRDTLTAGQWDVLRRTCESACLGVFDTRPTRAASALLGGLRQRSEQPEPTG